MVSGVHHGRDLPRASDFSWSLRSQSDLPDSGDDRESSGVHAREWEGHAEVLQKGVYTLAHALNLIHGPLR